MPSETATPPRSTTAHRLHPFTLLFQSVAVARALLFPALAAALGGAGDDAERAITLGLGVLTVPAILAAIARFASFRYRLAGPELILDSGVISRRRRVIPLERIQNIDVRQSWLERVCGVAEVRIETAGGKETEAVLKVLRHADAAALRTELLRRRQAARAGAAGVTADEAVPAEAPVERLVHLSPGELALAGATANEIGLLAATLVGLLQFADNVPFRLPVPPLDPTTVLPQSPALGIALIMLALVSLAVFVGWTVSILAAVIGYHGFTLERAGGELRKRYGLLGRREGSVPLRRVQVVRVEESLLRRPLARATLRVETAGATPGQQQQAGAEAFVPITRRAQIGRLVAAVFDDVDYDAFQFRPVHPRARRRLFLRYSLPVVLAAAGLALLHDPRWLLLLIAEAPLFAIAHAQYRALGYALLPGYVAARTGFFNRVTWIVPDRKIQTLHVRETPFQRRHRLATVVVDTAGGGRLGAARIRDLPHDEAQALLTTLERRATQRG